MKFGIRELLFIGLLAAIPVGSYFWVFKPANENYKVHKEECVAKEKKMDDLNEALSNISDLNAEVEKLANAVSFFENKLPAQHEIHKVLEQVTKIAKKQNLDTRLFKTLKSKPFATYSEQPIEMEVYGDFDSFYQFMLDLEKMPRITKINKMKLEKDEDKEGNMSVAFTLSIYFSKETTS